MQSPSVPESVTRTHISVSNQIGYSAEVANFASLVTAVDNLYNICIIRFIRLYLASSMLLGGQGRLHCIDVGASAPEIF